MTTARDIMDRTDEIMSERGFNINRDSHSARKTRRTAGDELRKAATGNRFRRIALASSSVRWGAKRSGTTIASKVTAEEIPAAQEQVNEKTATGTNAKFPLCLGARPAGHDALSRSASKTASRAARIFLIRPFRY